MNEAFSNTHKIAVRDKLRQAVRAKKIIRPRICSQCCAANVQIDGHHDDYNNPFEVIWLCPHCHRALHGGDILPVLQKGSFHKSGLLEDKQVDARRYSWDNGYLEIDWPTCFGGLSEIEAAAVQSRFGFLGESPLTYREIAVQLGCTFQRAHQATFEGLAKLRVKLRGAL